ncbi:MAG: hypothetical protein COB81_03165 [Flavobacteriaceae bacterium]|nr:MAG: hypothetical protein COB81_03165 [Flavobacteriaceae bacterium]
MKSMQQWFSDYAISHQNPTNQTIHYICVPAIFFSIIGLIMSIPSSFLIEKTGINNPIIINWSVLILVPILIFYLRLSVKVFIQMLLFSAVCIVGNYYISLNINLLLFSIVLFIIAWIGQFYGHKLEGKKPSFLKDLQFLLIGPAWVFKKIFS